MSKSLNNWLSQINQGDCVEGMGALPKESVDLVFADPPFNIGYSYDVYDDRLESEKYLAWSNQWISAVYNVLKPNGTFWLAIGDEYAAELKLESQKVGFHCRSWVIWYYTFGVNCSKKFTRSHAHLFHFVKDPADFTFRDEELDNRVPSARELVYNDKRANPQGRLPDDTWIIRPANAGGELSADELDTWVPYPLPIGDPNQTFSLRPQELEESFQAHEDTWYIPRVAGTFKERAGFHGCQMPEQLLGRIIRTCSEPNAIVLDPFSGSATTLAVAKKLGRHFIGFELSEDYAKFGTDRLEGIHVGDRLDGSPEPMKSTYRGKQKRHTAAKQTSSKQAQQLMIADPLAAEEQIRAAQLELTGLGIVEAFRLTHQGFSADRVIADPELNEAFVRCCQKLGLLGTPQYWNALLLRQRKAGKLSVVETTRRTEMSWVDLDPFLFASEIAWQMLVTAGRAKTIDEILCDPELAREFDELATRYSPGYQSLEYRWAAIKLRKQAKTARGRAAALKLPKLTKLVPIDEFNVDDLSNQRGLYVIRESRNKCLYAGETSTLNEQLSSIVSNKAWHELSPKLFLQTANIDQDGMGPLAWQSCMVTKLKPRLNCQELLMA